MRCAAAILQAACAALALLAWACAERVEYRYRPDYIAQNQGRPSEEIFYKPDGTKVVISSKVPGSEMPPMPTPPPAKATDGTTPSPTDAPPPLQTHTPDMVVEALMAGLREQSYEELYTRLVSPQQKQRTGDKQGRVVFVKFCEQNRRELMASCLRMCSSIRSGQASIEQVSDDMTRYQLPNGDRGAFGFMIIEIDRTPDGLRLACVR